MDLKCPGSGECERNLWSNLDHLTMRDEIKFVVADRADYEWARDAIVTRELSRRAGALLLSPVLRATRAGRAGLVDIRGSIAGADAIANAQADLAGHHPRRVIALFTSPLEERST